MSHTTEPELSSRSTSDTPFAIMHHFCLVMCRRERATLSTSHCVEDVRVSQRKVRHKFNFNALAADCW